MDDFFRRDDLLIRRIWHLPRAVVPVAVSAERSSNASGSSSSSERESHESLDGSFFDDLDQRLNASLPDAMLASLPEDLIAQGATDDPIHELDAIIDREDVSTPFHDALDHLQDPSEFINPNLNIPRATEALEHSLVG